MNDIKEKTEEIRARVKAKGGYQLLAGNGLTYHWIQKFACGAIKNPTVDNVAKLEVALNHLESQE